MQFDTGANALDRRECGLGSPAPTTDRVAPGKDKVRTIHPLHQCRQKVWGSGYLAPTDACQRGAPSTPESECRGPTRIAYSQMMTTDLRLLRDQQFTRKIEGNLAILGQLPVGTGITDEF